LIFRGKVRKVKGKKRKKREEEGEWEREGKEEG
jgi:hypothetical protein